MENTTEANIVEECILLDENSTTKEEESSPTSENVDEKFSSKSTPSTPLTEKKTKIDQAEKLIKSSQKLELAKKRQEEKVERYF